MGREASIDWNDLRLFLAILDAGSMTKASTIIGVSQPTLGRRLKQLEERLGASLFVRHPNSLEPTSFGRRIATLLTPVRATIAGLSRLAELKAAEHVIVRLSASTTFSMILAEHLPELTQGVPGMVLDIASTRQLSQIGSHESDMAIRLRKPPVAGPVVSRRMGVIAFAVYGARNLVGDTTKSFRWCAGIPYIGLSDDRPEPQPAWLDGFMVERGGALAYRLGEVFLRLSAVKSGLGVSLLPCILGDREPVLVRLTPPIKELTEDAYLLIHADLSRHPVVRTVASNIQSFFRMNSARLAGVSARD